MELWVHPTLRSVNYARKKQGAELKSGSVRGFINSCTQSSNTTPATERPYFQIHLWKNDPEYVETLLHEVTHAAFFLKDWLIERSMPSKDAEEITCTFLAQSATYLQTIPHT